MNIKYEWSKIQEKFWLKLAWMVSKKLAYWCAIRLGANATQGKYSSQEVPELSYMEALERWDTTP